MCSSCGKKNLAQIWSHLEARKKEIHNEQTFLYTVATIHFFLSFSCPPECDLVLSRNVFVEPQNWPVGIDITKMKKQNWPMVIDITKKNSTGRALLWYQTGVRLNSRRWIYRECSEQNHNRKKKLDIKAQRDGIGFHKNSSSALPVGVYIAHESGRIHDCLAAQEPWEFHWRSIHTIDVPEQLNRVDLSDMMKLKRMVHSEPGWAPAKKPTVLRFAAAMVLYTKYSVKKWPRA